MDTSPVNNQMTFQEALEELLVGKKVTKLEWDNENIFGVIQGEYLMLCTLGKYGAWMLSLGDLKGTDFVVVNQLEETNKE